jgi:hypothetical protein
VYMPLLRQHPPNESERLIYRVLPFFGPAAESCIASFNFQDSSSSRYFGGGEGTPGKKGQHDLEGDLEGTVVVFLFFKLNFFRIL